MPKVFPFFRDGTPFSNWWLRTLSGQNYQFIDSTGTKYLCTEQWMMAEKARLFNDPVTEDLIMKAKLPKDHKRLGRLVKNFDQKVWDQNCRRIMFEGLYLKFTQHPDAKKALLATDDDIICEASPYDAIWGIKLGPDDPRALDPTKWRGTNFLGYELMNVRQKILQEEAQKVKEVQKKKKTNSKTTEPKQKSVWNTEKVNT